MKPPRCAIYFNATGKKVKAGADPATFVELMKMQLVNTVMWEPTIKNMVIDGVEDFYEVGPLKQPGGNARVQITTWDPTRKDAPKPGKDTVDYADKHWSGLIGDYYKPRVEVVMKQALIDAKAGRALDEAAVDRAKAILAYHWTTSQEKYPTSPVGDAVVVSKKMHNKYKDYFATCSSTPTSQPLNLVSTEYV